MKRQRRRSHTLPGDSSLSVKRTLTGTRAVMALAREFGQPCILCQGPGGDIHTYTPVDRALWGMPLQGRTSRIYALCPDCERRADVEQAVLATLWREWQALRLARAAPYN